MWKSQDFCINQILREINFGESQSSKTANFPFLRLLILLSSSILALKVAKMHGNQNSEPLIVLELQILHFLVLQN